MKILHLPKYTPAGASSRHRTWDVLSGLPGVELDSHPLLDDEYLRGLYRGQARRPLPLALAGLRRAVRLARRPEADVAVVEKELFPWLPWFLERGGWPSQLPVVVDFDDAIHANYAGHRWLEGKIASVMAQADIVVAGNSLLARYAREVAGATRVEIIPTTVRCERYRPRGPGPGRLRAGWIGTPMTQKFIMDILPQLDALAVDPGLELVLVGARPNRQTLARPWIRCLAWSPEVEEDLGAQFDVGLMPLRDDEFERGKCGFKLLQYGACGLPVVASAVGANVEIVVEGVTGSLVRRDGDWASQLRALAAEPELRSRWGTAGRRRVEEHYDRGMATSRWREILGTLAAGGREG